MSEDKKKCFVIMPISDAEGYDKGHFTRVYEHLVKPAVIEAGFEPMRADDTSKANFIVVDILKQILESDELLQQKRKAYHLSDEGFEEYKKFLSDPDQKKFCFKGYYYVEVKEQDDKELSGLMGRVVYE